MKQIITITIAMTFIVISAFGQNASLGMQYQAVARDDDGKALSDQMLEIKVEMMSIEAQENVWYAEYHTMKSNEFGLINLTIGQGETEKGVFSEIPWSEQNVWARISIKKKGQSDYQLVSTSKLYSVPYAFYAEKSGSLVTESDKATKSERPNCLADECYWSLNGNANLVAREFIPKLGTLDATPIRFVTRNIERMHLSTEGDLEIYRNVRVGDKLTTRGMDVTGKAIINSKEGGTLIYGETEIGGPDSNSASFTGDVQMDRNLDVDGNLDLGGSLDVDGITNLNDALFVNNEAPTLLTGTLTVEGEMDLNSALQVGGATLLLGTLDVEGVSTLNGTTNINDQLNVTDNIPDGEHLVTFFNTNKGDGDVLKLKLGKDRTTLAPPQIPDLLTAVQVEDIRNLIRCDFNGSKPNLLGDIVLEGLIEDVEVVAGLAVGLGNLLVGFINNQIGLPVDFPTITMPEVEIPSLSSPSINIDIGITDFTIPSLGIPGTPQVIFPETDLIEGFELIPTIPEVNLSFFGIDEIPIDDLGFWGIPDICLSDTDPDPLNNENEFITFVDNNEVKMGTIRAVSVTDWTADYLDPVFLFKLHGALNSAVDKKHARYHFRAELSDALKAYLNIGVEYSSGNGDYAEWLERLDKTEVITPGDIVAVKGGKITKDLKEAEQVMVVSHNPIVLGNIPPEDKTQDGNNVAFMGQVPVKILGPVKTGDYIVAKPSVPGYGSAKNQNEMTVEDFKFTVGRAWEEDLSNGPKMVNTVVGIHNGDYFKVLKTYEAKINALEQQMDEASEKYNSLESKVDLLYKSINMDVRMN